MNIGVMKLQLSKLQKSNKKAKKLKHEFLKGWKNINNLFQYQSLSYILEVIYFKMINCHYNNLLIGYFGIDKT